TRRSARRGPSSKSCATSRGVKAGGRACFLPKSPPAAASVPELPEVETIRRDLEPLLLHRRIERVAIHAGAERLAITDAPRALERALAGRCVEAIERQGKYLVLRLD